MAENRAIRTLLVSLSLVVIASCQSFPGLVPASPTGILGDDVLSTVVTGMSPEQINQLKQHRLSLQIKKAGGDVTLKMALYPASTVVGVDLHQTQVMDEDLLQAESFPNLRTLNLYGTHITDAGLENLVALRSLQTLRLAYTDISDAGLQSLKKLPDIRELGLTHTKVTDQGLATLATMKTLTELTLSGSQITDAGLKQLGALHISKSWCSSKPTLPKPACNSSSERCLMRMCFLDERRSGIVERDVYGISPRRKRQQGSTQVYKIDWLNQVKIETGDGQGLLVVFVTAVSCKGDDIGRFEGRFLPKRFRNVVAAHSAGQPDVAENHLRRKVRASRAIPASPLWAVLTS